MAHATYKVVLAALEMQDQNVFQVGGRSIVEIGRRGIVDVYRQFDLHLLLGNHQPERWVDPKPRLAKLALVELGNEAIACHDLREGSGNNQIG